MVGNKSTKFSEIRNILMKRDDMTAEQADELISQCAEELDNGNFNAIQEYLGLEDDYIFAFI